MKISLRANIQPDPKSMKRHFGVSCHFCDILKKIIEFLRSESRSTIKITSGKNFRQPRLSLKFWPPNLAASIAEICE